MPSSGGPLAQKVAVTLDGARRRPGTHDVAVDLDDLAHGASCALTHDDPDAFDHGARGPRPRRGTTKAARALAPTSSGSGAANVTQEP